VYWRRPGKEKGWSATTGHCRGEVGGDLLYVFSSNAHPFEAEKAYSKFSAYAILRHGGDHAEAARELARDPRYRVEPARVRGTRHPDSLNGTPRPNADNSADPLDADATAADLIAHNATIRWAWEGWIPLGALTILASEPGVGKTRFCADLLRRIREGLPWPDGKAMTFPTGACALWVAADTQHAELGTLPGSFGFPPQALYVNATRRNPFGGTMLDTANDLADFKARIARLRPALVFIDTTLNATDRTAHKPEDAKAFFVPLAHIALQQQVALLCVTHLNTSGKPLGRRIEGQGRVVIMLEKPDPDQEHRRKLYVRKSHSLAPPPLGVTMGTHGNDYDGNPPRAPEQEPARVRATGGDPEERQRCRDWLAGRLTAGPRRVGDLRNEAEATGFSAPALYRARDTLGVQEYTMAGRKWWRLQPPEDASQRPP
jgi:hypothetical protein